MSVVSYNSKKLIPAPLISIQKSFIQAGNGTNIGSTYQISVNGTLFAYKGSPTSSGSFWDSSGYPPDETVPNDARLAALTRKQEALRSLFATQGASFEVQSVNGSPPLKFNPRIVGITFEEGIWFDQCRYTIQMEADFLSVFGNITPEDNYLVQIESIVGSGLENKYVYLQSASESYNVEYDQDRDVFAVSHELSAQGKNVYNPDITGYESAKNWVLSKMGITNEMNAPGVWSNSFSAANGYDYNRVQRSSELNGSFEVSESWVFSSKPYVEQYTVEVNQGDTTQVSIQGEVQGLASRTMNTIGNSKLGSLNPSGVVYGDRYVAASGAFYGPTDIKGKAYTRALELAQVPYVNPTPVQWSISTNKRVGLINYSFVFNSAAPNVIPGARFESIIINDNLPSDVFAVIPVLGRTKGPIIQSIGTITERRRTLTIEVALTGVVNTIDKKLSLLNYRPDYSAIVEASKPTLIPSTNLSNTNPDIYTSGIKVNPQATKIYVEQDTESWDVNTLRGTKNITWVYTAGPG